MTIVNLNSQESEVIEKLYIEISPYFEQTNGAHDFEHTKRVLRLCYHIGAKENVNYFVLTMAALLHDIARREEDLSKGQICHAKKGAQIAKNILFNLNLSQKIITMVSDCIKTHRFRNNDKPKSIEAKILFDADKLDSIGATGIGRAFLFAGEFGATLHVKDVDINATQAYSKQDTAYREFKIKLSKVKDAMLTKKGREMAQIRHDFMVKFFIQLDSEFEGVL